MINSAMIETYAFLPMHFILDFNLHGICWCFLLSISCMLSSFAVVFLMYTVLFQQNTPESRLSVRGPASANHNRELFETTLARSVQVSCREAGNMPSSSPE